MRYAKKRKSRIVHAWVLGAGSETERRLIGEDTILREQDGRYRLFSLEAVNGVGELAEPGDYFKEIPHKRAARLAVPFPPVI